MRVRDVAEQPPDLQTIKSYNYTRYHNLHPDPSRTGDDVIDHRPPYNQFSHHSVKKEGFFQGRTIADITAVQPKFEPGSTAASGSTSTAPAPASSSGAETSDSCSKPKQKTRIKKKTKGGNRRKKDWTDFKEKALVDTGPKPSSATQRPRKSASEFETRTLCVGSLARNICSCLRARRDSIKYPFKSPDFFCLFPRVEGACRKNRKKDPDVREDRPTVPKDHLRDRDASY